MVALALLSAVTTVLTAWSLSQFIAGIFISHERVSESLWLLWIFLGAGAARAILLWLQEVLSVQAALNVKIQLRAKLLSAISCLGSKWVSENQSARISLLATTSLDALDNYFSKYLPQLFYTAIVTPLLVAVIFITDATSGLSVMSTIPLIPLFMVLIGLATRKVQEQQLDAQGQLSQHFLEVVRGLLTLKIFNRAEAQVEAIKRVSELYRTRTMKVLKVSFLSGFALELISSLSVAIVAVSIGLRLVDGTLSLSVGLFVLILAPEAFLPLRMVGANFHASSEGIVASKNVLDIIDQAREPRQLATPSLPLEPGKIVWIQGKSGSGKSTALRREYEALGKDEVCWMPQRPGLFAGSVLSNIVGPQEIAKAADLKRATRMAGLNDLPLDSVLSDDGTSISGGQAQRVALARTFYRALTDDSVRFVLLDEPFSALDSRHAHVAERALRELASRRLAIAVVSHQSLQSADSQLRIEAENV